MSKIEWTDTTWNPIVGCSKKSTGCKNCYAIRMAGRLATMPQTRDAYEGITENGNWTGVLRLLEDRIEQPLKWRKPRMVFVNSMSDLFHPDVPFEWVDKIFAVIAMSPEHTFQILTKRPQRMSEYSRDPETPGRIARAIDSILVDREIHMMGKERLLPIDGFPGYFVSDHGNIYTDRGSSVCVRCGKPIPGGLAKKKYCSSQCNQMAAYDRKTGKNPPKPTTGKLIKPDVGPKGHLRVPLYRASKKHRVQVHRLVLSAFVRSPKEGEQACHLNGDPSENSIPNLRWGTQSDNWKDRKRHGKGRSYSKLSSDDVEEIRERISCGHPIGKIALDYKVSSTQIRNIKNGSQWATEGMLSWPLPNCWKGTSVENQETADERIPHLRRTLAAIKFLSCEPLLGSIDLKLVRDRSHVVYPRRNYMTKSEYAAGGRRPELSVDWVICGGESGPGARMMDPDWARSLRNQCRACDVPFFMKQMTKKKPIPGDLLVREFPSA